MRVQNKIILAVMQGSSDDMNLSIRSKNDEFVKNTNVRMNMKKKPTSAPTFHWRVTSLLPILKREELEQGVFLHLHIFFITTLYHSLKALLKGLMAIEVLIIK